MNFSITVIHWTNIEVFFMSGIVLGMQSMLVNQKKILKILVFMELILK